MSDKTKEQLEEVIRVGDLLKAHSKEEMERADKTYARKVAETLIFGFVGMALVAVVGALLKLVVFAPK